MSNRMRVLTALPVYNEQPHVAEVLRQVEQYCADILVVDDGSKDGTLEEVRKFPQVQVVSHPTNLGYGAGLRTAFHYAQQQRYDVLVTIDCDGQHEPRLIPELVAALTDDVDIVSGSRYLKLGEGQGTAPSERRRINRIITELINTQLGLNLTDAFCGFKAYRVSQLDLFEITELGYAMPLQLWVQAVATGLRIVEYPVPLIYLEESRSFGGALDDADYRLRHYLEVFDTELARYIHALRARFSTEEMPPTFATLKTPHSTPGPVH